jgi:glycosyltransferase involved in cell wall biosynthesis
LKFAELLAVQASRFHVADSPVIKEYLDHKYTIRCKYIAYGAELDREPEESLLEEYGLQKNDYFLLMARMEPENNIEMILDGYCLSNSETRFVVIGNIGNGYGRQLAEKYRNEKRIVFLGALFDEAKVHSITSFCKLYFHGHTVGGTNPSLLDAMAARAPLAIHDNMFNKTITNGNALLFTNSSDVSDLIRKNGYSNEVFIENNYTAIKSEYNWSRIIDQYESYFMACSLSNTGYYPLKHEERILYKR